MEEAFIIFRGKKLPVKSNSLPINLVIPDYNIIIKDTVLGKGVTIWSNVNIYGAWIGSETKIGSFVEVRKGVKIGAKTKIEPFVFIPEGVEIGEGVFIGPHVCFTNDRWPRACQDDGSLITDYEIIPTVVEDFASIGAGSTIVCGLRIGKRAMVGAGSLVSRDIPADVLAFGVPARVKRYLK